MTYNFSFFVNNTLTASEVKTQFEEFLREGHNIQIHPASIECSAPYPELHRFRKCFKMTVKDDRIGQQIQHVLSLGRPFAVDTFKYNYMKFGEESREYFWMSSSDSEQKMAVAFFFTSVVGEINKTGKEKPKLAIQASDETLFFAELSQIMG